MEMSRDSFQRRRFRALFDAHGEQILLYFRRRAGGEVARECAADTFLVAWRRIDDIPSDGELAWLYGVARRVLSQHRRSVRRRFRLMERLGGLASAAEPGVDSVVVRSSEHAAVLDALGQLRPRDQELLRLAVWDELPHSEIAEVLGCSTHAVDQRLYRAKRNLARGMRSSGRVPVQSARAMPEAEEEAS